jgi:hypothetical protein
MPRSSPLAARALLTALGAPLVPCIALHAQRQPPSIPSELAVALLSGARPIYLESGGVPLFTVGRAPDYFPRALIPPRPIVLVGGMWTGSGGSIVVALPKGQTDALAAVERALADSGWRRPASTDAQRGPFVSGGAPTRPPVLCRKDNESAMLSPAHSASGNAAVRIDYLGDLGPGCASRLRTPPAFIPTEVLTVPTLEAPPGAVASAASMMGGGDRIDAAVRLVTSLAADEVAEAYASQLTKAGWTAGVGAQGAGVVVRPLTYTFPSGATWRGVLTVLVLSPTGRDVTLRMARGM